MKKNIFKKCFFYLVSMGLLFVPQIVNAAVSCTIKNTDCIVPKVPTFWLVTSSAFVDAINPCAITVLLFLLSALLFFGDRKKLLKVALSFILGIFLTYLLFGIGFFYILKLNQYIFVSPALFHNIMGTLAIIIGLFNIKDFFWYGGGGFVMEIPRRWRPKMSMIIAKATTVPAAFLTGFIVTLFALPCTGGPYVFVLGVLSTHVSKVLIIPILLYYNLVLIFPLLLILGAVYFGLWEVGKAEHWKERNLRLLHLIAGLVLVFLGLWVLSSSPLDYIMPFLASLFKSLFFISSRLSHFFLLFANPISSLMMPFLR
jgi:cytochrome c biogenesis protein CcdA